MNVKPIVDTEPIEDPNAVLEKALIAEFIKEQGYTHDDLKKLPAEAVKKLMKEAYRYASLKMEEVKARANFVKELHDDAAPLEKV